VFLLFIFLVADYEQCESQSDKMLTSRPTASVLNYACVSSAARTHDLITRTRFIAARRYAECAVICNGTDVSRVETAEYAVKRFFTIYRSVVAAIVMKFRRDHAVHMHLQ